MPGHTRSCSFVFYGEKPDESVWNFLTVNVRRRGVSLATGGQNSLWTNESLCLTGNTQGLRLGGGGAAPFVVSSYFGMKNMVQESTTKERARLTQWRVSDGKGPWQACCRPCQAASAASQPGRGTHCSTLPSSFLYGRMERLPLLP